jgi:hypothetical protein
VSCRNVRLSEDEGGNDRTADGAGAAAQVHDDRSGSGQQVDRHVHEELRAASGHEDPRLDGHPLAAELDPAEDLLQGLSGHATGDHRLEPGRGRGGVDDQRRLVPGIDAAGLSKRRLDTLNDRAVGQRAAEPST